MFEELTKTEQDLIKFIGERTKENADYFFYHGNDEGKTFLSLHSLTAPKFGDLARSLEKREYLANRSGIVAHNVSSDRWFITERGKELCGQSWIQKISDFFNKHNALIAFLSFLAGVIITLLLQS